MFKKTLIFTIICCLISSFAFSLPVPSEGAADATDAGELYAGGGNMTDQELILVIVGAVLGTIILLAILN